ncbi:MAG: phage baseplate assembly protein [Pseudomonadota bacterium]
MDRVEVVTAGEIFTGWLRASIERGVDRLASSFSMVVAEKPWPIAPGDAVEIRLGGERLVTGFVDQVEPRYDAGQHLISVSGRSRTCDVIDCPSAAVPGQWSGLTTEEITRALVEPFGIAVTLEGPPGEALREFRIEQGRRVGDMIEEVARLHGLLATDDPAGDIILITPGERRADGRIVRGENVLRARATARQTDRFSVYRIKAQRPSDDQSGATAAAGILAEANDDQVHRYRPMIITPPRPLDEPAAREMAEYERRVRFGRSYEASFTVQGWRQGGGSIWRPGDLVSVSDDWLRLDGEMLIASCRYAYGPDGQTTEINLVRPDAFARAPQVEAGSRATAQSTSSTIDGAAAWADVGISE